MAANTSPDEFKQLRGRLAMARRWGHDDADLLQQQLHEKTLERHIRNIAPTLRNDQRVRLAQIMLGLGGSNVG